MFTGISDVTSSKSYGLPAIRFVVSIFAIDEPGFCSMDCALLLAHYCLKLIIYWMPIFGENARTRRFL